MHHAILYAGQLGEQVSERLFQFEIILLNSNSRLGNRNAEPRDADNLQVRVRNRLTVSDSKVLYPAKLILDHDPNEPLLGES
jgi:hypothetical protein